MKPELLPTARVTTPPACYHCGESCQEEHLSYAEKDFCCTGCQLVYQVLSEADMCSTYYALESQPGSSQKSRSERENRFDYLLDTEVEGKLIDFKNERETHITFSIPLIHCASCIWLLENLDRLHRGVISGRVDFMKKQVQIKFLHEVLSLRDLVRLLSSIGYEPRIQLADVVERKATSALDKTLIFKLAVAGFCFGNMMFFSLPEYFSEAALLGDSFKGLFNYLNVLLALPVFFYAATDYYRSAWLALKNRQVNMDVPIAIGIVTLFSYSLYEIFMLGQEGYMDTLGGLLFFLLLGKLYQAKTYETLSFDRDYTAYFPVAVTRLQQGREEVVPLTKLEVGDVLLIRDQELIPADSILLEGQAFIDYSFVTGEEVPVAKKKGELLYAGGRQKGQAITLVVQKSPSQGYLTDLWNQEAFAKKESPGLESLATKISGKFTAVVLLIALGSLVFWAYRGEGGLAVQTFTAVLIITCPCALAMSTPFTLGNTLRIFGRKKLYLKNGSVIEKMAAIDTLVFDKTGTLTDPAHATITYEGFTGATLSTIQKSIVKAMVGHSTHALSNRLHRYFQDIQAVSLDSCEEVQGKGLLATHMGSIYRLGSASFTGLPQALHQSFSGNQVVFAQDDRIIGYFLLHSGLREGMEEMIGDLSADYPVHLLSGDQDHERASMAERLGQEVQLNFRQSPQEKLAYLEKLRSEGRHALMLGDGLNDAGALKAAHVGIALTDQASHFSPASDAILDASMLAQLPRFLRFSRQSRNVIKASFGLSFTYNAFGVYFAVQGLISPLFCAILMPLSSLSVVLFTTLATNYLAYRQGLHLKPTASWK